MDMLDSKVTEFLEKNHPAAMVSLRFFRALQGLSGESDTITWYGQPRTIDEFRKLMVEDQRILYEFDVQRWYGMY